MDVYWSPFSLNGIMFDIPRIVHYEPERVLPDLIKKYKNDSRSFIHCPAFRDTLNNTFSLKFPFDYNLQFNQQGGVKALERDQQFFDKMISIRSTDDKLYSIQIGYIFIAEKDLEIEVTPAFLSDNDFVNKTMMIPGKYNIGRWSRPVECAFLLKDNVTNLSIKTGEDYLYARFLTDEKINLKMFHMTPQLNSYLFETLGTRDLKLKLVPSLSYYYNLYTRANAHKYVLKQIKENLYIDE